MTRLDADIDHRRTAHLLEIAFGIVVHSAFQLAAIRRSALINDVCRKMPHRRRLVQQIILTLSLLCLGPNASSCSDASLANRVRSISIEDIKGEWQTRERQVEAAQFTWHLIREELLPQSFRGEFALEKVEPLNSDSHSMKISGSRLLYEATRSYAELSDEFGPLSKPHNFDKFVYAMQRGWVHKTNWETPPLHFKLLWTPQAHHEALEASADAPCLGTIRDPAYSLRLGSREAVSPGLLIWPPLMCVRPLIATGLASEDLTLMIERHNSVIGDHRCVVVVVSSGDTVNSRLWLDPDRGFTVVRAMGYADNRLRNQLDISYEADETAGFVPKSWTSMVFSSAEDYPGEQEIFQSAHMEMDRCRLNGAAEPAITPVEFPRDSLVRDADSGTVSYIIGPNETRPATARETRVFFDRGEPDFVDPKPILSSYTLTIGAAMVTAIAMLIFLQAKKRREARPVKASAV